MENTRAETHRQAWAERSERRRLLLKAMGLGAAGLAAGGLAAWTKGELDTAAAAGLTLADTQRQLETTNTAKAALALSYSTLQTQANDWQTQLTAASAQNAQLAGAVNAAQQEASDLKAKLAAAQTALDAVNKRLARSQDLIGLYNQLDGVGLDGVVATGLGVVSGALAGVAGPAALLRDGVDAAHGLLTNFEQVLPHFNSAMAWLGEQVVKTKVALWAVESAAQQAANSTLSGVTAVFGGFVSFVLDHLPFNIGANVRQTLSEVQTLLTGVTTLSDQAADQVLLKISRYVDDGPQGWQQALVTPLRTNTLAPAGQVLAAVSGASDAFHSSLNQPTQAALQQRQALRDQIANFRSTHGL
jgi:multidrug efflux pump subunit AcrA (membrane-fusion protein)